MSEAKPYSAPLMRMVGALTKDPKLREEWLAGGREAILDRYGISAEQRELLELPTWENLAKAGIPSVGQIGYMLYTVPPLFQHLNMKDFLPRLIGEDGQPCGVGAEIAGIGTHP